MTEDKEKADLAYKKLQEELVKVKTNLTRTEIDLQSTKQVRDKQIYEIEKLQTRDRERGHEIIRLQKEAQMSLTSAHAWE